MATNLLSIDTTAATSSDVTLAGGERATLSLKNSSGNLFDGPTLVWVQIKDDAGAYFDFRQLGNHNTPMVVDGPCTFRVKRLAGSIAVGVFQG